MGKNIRLAATCACILVPLLCLCLHARGGLIDFADGEAPYYLWNKDVTNSPQEKKYDVIILGDSAANDSYLPAVLSDSCLNLALGGTTPLENYYTLKEWLELHDAPKVCYISFMDGHFQTAETFWSRSVYTHRYHFREELAMVRAADEHNYAVIASDNPYSKLIEHELGLPNRYMTAMLNANYNQRRDGNVASRDRAALRGGAYIGGMGEYAVEDEVPYASFQVAPILDEYYKKIIELCQENGTDVRIVKLPLPDNATFSDQYKEEFYGYFDALQAEYPNILSVDWLGVYEKSYFGDPVHMNHHGANRFSNEIKQLHPEDFDGDSCSDAQAAAISSYIAEENNASEILKWINGRNYCAVILDDTGEWKEYFQEEAKEGQGMEDLEVKEIPAGEIGDFDGEAYLVKGAKGASEIPLKCADGAVSLDIGNGLEGSYPTGDDLLSVFVVDEYNNSIVFAKNFRWQDDKFIL